MQTKKKQKQRQDYKKKNKASTKDHKLENETLKKKPKTHTNAPKLRKSLYEAWRNALLNRARIRNTEAQQNPESKLLTLMRQEYSSIEKLWQIFNLERDDIGRYLAEPKKQAISYLLGFHLPNVVRTQAMLKRSHLFDRLALTKDKAKSIIVHDLGCGTGALSSAFIDILEEKRVPVQRLTICLADSRGAFLDTAKGLLEPQLKNFETQNTMVSIKSFKGTLSEYSRLLESKNRHTDTEEDGENVINVVLLGYIWNEISHKDREQQGLMSILERFSKQQSIAVYLEPANQKLSRSAMEFRQEMIQRNWSVKYPCPQSHDCPMLERSRDWCYSEFIWQPPTIIKKLDQRLGIDRSKLSASAYIFSSETDSVSSHVEGTYDVVVGRPLKASGGPSKSSKTPSRNQKMDYLLCDGEELKKRPSSYYHPKDASRLLRGTRALEKKIER
jgi:hypothetical protein